MKIWAWIEPEKKQETCVHEKEEIMDQLTLGSKGVPNPVFYLDSIAIWSRWTFHTYPLLAIHCNSRCTIQCDQGIFFSTSDKDTLVTMRFNYNLGATLHATSSTSTTASTTFLCFKKQWRMSLSKNNEYMNVDAYLEKAQISAHNNISYLFLRLFHRLFLHHVHHLFLRLLYLCCIEFVKNNSKRD